MSHQLPYPSINFVPLDVLTAEELNQIVANTNDLATLFPIKSENIANGAIGTNELASRAVTSAKIASQAVTSSKIDWSDISTNQVITLGSTKIMSGIQDFYVASGEETPVTINFPATFNNIPNVVACCGNWIAQPIVMVTDATTTYFKAVLRQVQGSTQTFPVRYIAVG